ncbi:hypothetical protein K458DRAFT_442336 [Lentithecium fluviatile CBS 122367]|uniref:DUF2293 domain-containing protein n=1 Tax=Lentithecium fluviatile CBS 122367 TaxID=1168545 RepID=A0A6G1J4W4_9PLEO|nr:hypothetical protein K458DRAFT_442336 [Lentithecium fluviatile CBS 122367]
MAPREITVSPSRPIPTGYAFLKKGIKYKTLHCRRLTHEAGKPVYIVEHRKKVLGICVPQPIFDQVQAQADETLAARRLATEQRDAALIRTAAAELDKQFPRIPKVDREKVLAHGFKKHSGRVGRTSQIPLQRKVLYAVSAHIRHAHTRYEAILDKGGNRDDARKAIQKTVQDTLRFWSATRGRK